jgi:hypothetical protein
VNVLYDLTVFIWSKPRFVLGRGDYRWQHEPRQGARDQSTVWAIGTKR